MKSERVGSHKSYPATIKSFPKLFKILLAIFIGVIFLVLSIRFSDFVYCHTVAICDPVRPTMSAEMIATQVVAQYDMAIKDINFGRYEVARQRLDYVVHFAPEYLSAKEKLLEVEKIIQLTATP